MQVEPSVIAGHVVELAPEVIERCPDCAAAAYAEPQFELAIGENEDGQKSYPWNRAFYCPDCRWFWCVRVEKVTYAPDDGEQPAPKKRRRVSRAGST